MDVLRQILTLGGLSGSGPRAFPLKAALTLGAALFGLQGAHSWAHAEHDKPRYVSESGTDTGGCERTSAPCKTIAYAAGQANKGDRILVASGSYVVEDTATLFHLISDVVPVEGGYAPRSFKRAPDQQPTRLIGVPPAYADELAARGFQVIVDRKGAEGISESELSHKLALVSDLAQRQSQVSCTDGQANDYECNRVDLVAHIPLGELNTGTQAQGNDVWGHTDLNTGDEYALMGLSNGVAVVDLSTPETPRLVSHIPGANTTWRDIKVLQTYDAEKHRWQAWAYVTADNADIGLQILDLNALPSQVTLANTDTTDISAHNVYLSNVDYSTGVPLAGQRPFLHMAGSTSRGGAFNTYALDNPEAPRRIYRHPNNSRSNYSHDVASMLISDQRKDTQCVNGNDYCDILFDFNEDDVRLWDKTDNRAPEQLSSTSYPEATYIHSGWWTEDQQVLAVHDEMDERNHGLNATVRFFDISDLTQPTLLSTYTGSTHTIDHNGFVRGNRYYMSNYERGLTVLDLSDPAEPTEVGFFDTYPLGNNANFNGAWGVYPYLPSGLILVSDINSGLYILRDRTLDTDAGTLSFSARSYPVDEGEALSVEVQRSGGATGTISVGYETQTGSAGTDDVEMTSGRLSWADGDTETKFFDISIHSDDLGDELDELFFVRLFDPQGGASLSAPNLTQVRINGLPNGGSIGFDRPTAEIEATDLSIQVNVLRRGGGAGAVSVTLEVDAEDGEEPRLSLTPQTLTWPDGDTAPQTVALSSSEAPAEDQTRVIRLEGDNLDTESSLLEVTLRSESEAQPPANPGSGSGSSGGGTMGAGLLLFLVLLAQRIRRRARLPGNFHRSRLQQP